MLVVRAVCERVVPEIGVEAWVLDDAITDDDLASGVPIPQPPAGVRARTPFAPLNGPGIAHSTATVRWYDTRRCAGRSLPPAPIEAGASDCVALQWRDGS